MLDDISDTLTKPWREPMSLLDLCLYIVLFLIIAFGVHDMLRILSTFIKSK